MGAFPRTLRGATFLGVIMGARTNGHAFLILGCAATLAASLSATGAGCAGSSQTGSGGAGGNGSGGDATGGFGGAGGAGAGGMTATVGTAVTSTASTTGAGGSQFVCGNGILEGGEICDGSDFGGKTCVDYGLAGGYLQCNPFCQVVVSGCTPPESCANDQDDDEDGDTDCADSDCANVPSCLDSCVAPEFVALPAYEFSDTNGEPNVHKGSCTAGSGPEKIYKFTASADVDVAIDLSFTAANFSLSIRKDCGSAASELFCVDATGANDDESIFFKATKGQSYFVIVDGTGPTEFGYFDLQIQESFPESFCDDYFDDDFDGFTDCADPSACQGTNECKPGAGVAGAACMTHNECAANANDPICIDEFYFGWPNGYCSEHCNLMANDCPTGTLCSDYLGLNNGLGVCLKTCTNAASCPMGMGNQKYKCADFGEGFVCIY